MTTQNPPTATTVCIAGCGPAGAMLGLLLARAGVDVVVLEKHADFLRDFRGDTVHASTMQVLGELGLLEGFEKLPQQRTTHIDLMTDDGMVPLGDFTRLPGRFQCLSMVPQHEFLDFLTTEAARSPSFALHRQVEVIGLIEENGTVTGVRYRRTNGDGTEAELRALLTIAADGRHSAVRGAAGLSVLEFGSPLDVLWYRLPKSPGDPEASFARLVPGRLLPMIDRGSYWQGAYTMPKGTVASLKAAGIEALRADVQRAMPFLGDRADTALRSWDDTGFLEVRVNRVRRWYRPGLLCIGDAAHAMSPVAGVGINLAVQDAVAAANVLVAPLRRGAVTSRDLRRVQRRRDLPTRVTQLVQRGVQRQMFGAAGDHPAPARGVPVPLRLVSRVPPLLRLFSRFMAIGLRNEHVAVPAHATPTGKSYGPAQLQRTNAGPERREVEAVPRRVHRRPSPTKENVMSKELSAHIDIQAPPERVWTVLTDLAAYPEWNPFIVRAEGEVGPGCRLTLRMQPVGGGAMTVRPRLVEVAVNQELRWRGKLVMPGLMDAEHRFVLQTQTGGTRLIHQETFRGVLVPLVATSLHRNTLPAFVAMNEALKRRAENAPRTRARTGAAGGRAPESRGTA